LKNEKSNHHVTPTSRSRFGREVTLPKKFHSAWHVIFGNLYGREAELFIEEVNEMMDFEEEITNDDLRKARERTRGLELYEFQKRHANGRRRK